MGAADVIPGVSGGTVALVLGIYERLVGAISHFDRAFLEHLVARRWIQAWRHVDFGFLLALATGIGLGIVSLGTIIGGLLHDDYTRPLTLAAFFGMIAASAVLVARMVKMESVGALFRCAVLAIAAALFAYWLTTFQITAYRDPALGYLFLCGMIAICAMILPGISGAHILLILGAYTYVLGIIRGIVHGDLSGAALLSLGVFAAGCAVGLLAFSKVLRWLLDRYNAPTMAVLCGFMIGALRKVWPFQIIEEVEVGGTLREVPFPQWPAQVGSHELFAGAIGLSAFVVVLIVDYIAKAKKIGSLTSGDRPA